MKNRYFRTLLIASLLLSGAIEAFAFPKDEYPTVAMGGGAIDPPTSNDFNILVDPSNMRYVAGEFVDMNEIETLVVHYVIEFNFGKAQHFRIEPVPIITKKVYFKVSLPYVPGKPAKIHGVRFPGMNGDMFFNSSVEHLQLLSVGLRLRQEFSGNRPTYAISGGAATMPDHLVRFIPVDWSNPKDDPKYDPTVFIREDENATGQPYFIIYADTTDMKPHFAPPQSGKTITVRVKHHYSLENFNGDKKYEHVIQTITVRIAGVGIFPVSTRWPCVDDIEIKRQLENNQLRVVSNRMEILQDTDYDPDPRATVIIDGPKIADRNPHDNGDDAFKFGSDNQSSYGMALAGLYDATGCYRNVNGARRLTRMKMQKLSFEEAVTVIDGKELLPVNEGIINRNQYYKQASLTLSKFFGNLEDTRTFHGPIKGVSVTVKRGQTSTHSTLNDYTWSELEQSNYIKYSKKGYTLKSVRNLILNSADMKTASDSITKYYK